MSYQELADPKAKKSFMLTNEAVARAVLESDAKVTAFYPGSPTSEILDTLYMLSADYPDLKMEVSANEKVALETVAGASMAGARSFTSMKSVGLNVASDTFYTLGYVGVNAGCVLLVADDPHAHSSQSEQDGRFFAPTGHVPMLEPSTPQEAYDMAKYTFDLSERHKILTLIRTTTRVNHQYAPVDIGEVKRTPFQKKNWKDVKRPYFTLSDTARRLKGEALEKLAKIEDEFEKSPFNVVVKGKGRVGVITSGVSYLHTVEAAETLGVKPHILKLGTTHPLPRKLITDFAKKLSKVLIVEELMPYLEQYIKAIAKDADCRLEVLGKESGHFSYVGEYNVAVVAKALASIYDVKPPIDYDAIQAKATELKKVIPKRLPVFCAGCPHRSTLWALQQALKGTDFILNNDIGCYSMLQLEPYSLTDMMLCMGAGQGISSGMQHVVNDRIIALIGDSTLFHAGLPGLVNAIHNGHNYTLFILDNSVTAMTGQQPNPGSDFGPNKVSEIDIEAIVRGIGVKNVTKINAFDPKPNVETMKKAILGEGVNVVISVGPCALYSDRKKRAAKIPIIPNKVSKEVCKTIYACVRDFYCPAIQLDMETRQTTIQLDICNGCMVCAKLCPVSAISSTGGGQK
jgi:indolepyruvate ferredoxin oxidoreductase alpha subunit